MKKLLSIALILIMLCTLFIMPAAAEGVEVDYILYGDFENISIGVVTGAQANQAVEGYYSGSTSYTTEFVKKDGSTVLKNSSATKNIDFYFPEMVYENGKVYTVKYDMYFETDPSVETVSGVQYYPGYGNYGDLTANYPWKEAPMKFTARATGEDISETVAANNWLRYIGGTIPTNQWVTVEATFNCPLTVNATTRYMYTGANVDAVYIDNYSVTSVVDNALTVTEYNGDYGTVYGPAITPEGTKVGVHPKAGYYLHAALIDGVDTTSIFTRKAVLAQIEEIYYEAVIPEDAETLVIIYGQYDTGSAANRIIDNEGFESGATLSAEVSSECTVARSTDYNNTSGGSYSLKTTWTKTYGSSGQTIVNERIKSVNYSSNVYSSFAEAEELFVTEFDVYVTATPTAGLAYKSANEGRGVDGAILTSRPAPTGGQWTTYRFYTYGSLQTSATKNYSVFYIPGICTEYSLLRGYKAISYIDNVSITRLVPAESPIIPENSGARKHNVIVAKHENGKVKASVAAAKEGETVTITIAPDTGYYVSEATINGTNIVGDINVYSESAYAYTMGATDVGIIVSFAKIADGATDLVATTIPGVFTGKSTVNANNSAAVVFGAIDKSSGTIAEYGIEYRFGDDSPVVTLGADAAGPYFKASSAGVTGQYAVELQALPAGYYKARTYIKYQNGDYKYGQFVYFTIGE